MIRPTELPECLRALEDVRNSPSCLASLRHNGPGDGMIGAMATSDMGVRVYDDDVTRGREQRAWHWYEWAQSAFVTTVSVVLVMPYLTTIAETAAGCPDVPEAKPCRTDQTVLGIQA